MRVWIRVPSKVKCAARECYNSQNRTTAATREEGRGVMSERERDESRACERGRKGTKDDERRESEEQEKGRERERERES